MVKILRRRRFKAISQTLKEMRFRQGLDEYIREQMYVFRSRPFVEYKEIAETIDRDMQERKVGPYALHDPELPSMSTSSSRSSSQSPSRSSLSASPSALPSENNASDIASNDSDVVGSDEEREEREDGEDGEDDDGGEGEEENDEDLSSISGEDVGIPYEALTLSALRLEKA
jgi:hypothetical protein